MSMAAGSASSMMPPPAEKASLLASLPTMLDVMTSAEAPEMYRPAPSSASFRCTGLDTSVIVELP